MPHSNHVPVQPHSPLLSALNVSSSSCLRAFAHLPHAHSHLTCCVKLQVTVELNCHPVCFLTLSPGPSNMLLMTLYTPSTKLCHTEATLHLCCLVTGFSSRSLQRLCLFSFSSISKFLASNRVWQTLSALQLFLE